MHRPRHIYASTASRRERSWGRNRRRTPVVAAWTLLVTLVATLALASAVRLPL